MKMREVAFIFGPLYSAVKFCAFILTKYGLGEFFTNSACHPDANVLHISRTRATFFVAILLPQHHHKGDMRQPCMARMRAIYIKLVLGLL
jgi:hypothetical protein